MAEGYTPGGSGGGGGATGPAGPPGPGVPTGGTAAQALTKVDATNYNTQWSTIAAGGSALTVQDEGVTLSAAVTSLNFAGAGVTATGTTAVTVTVAGGGGGGTAAATTFSPAAGIVATNVQAALEEVAGDVTSLPTLTTSDVAKVPLSTTAGVTTLDVTNLASLNGTETLANKTLGTPLAVNHFSGGGLAIRSQADTFVNDYSRGNPFEIFSCIGLNSVIAFCHNGGSPGVPSATLNNGGLGRITARGYDGTAFLAASTSIFSTAAENYTTTNKGAYVGISTTPTGASQALTEVVRFTTDTQMAVRNALVVGAGSAFASPTAGYGVECKTGVIGYGVGTGGTVVQGTDKTTTVVLSKQSGQITMHAASLAANTAVSFTLTNTTVTAADFVAVSVRSGEAADGSYAVSAKAAAGSARITLRNMTAGALGEAVVLMFSVIRGVTT